MKNLWPPSRAVSVAIVTTVAFTVATGACSKTPTGPSPGPGPGPGPIGPRTEVLVGAGDIGECGSPGTEATGRLLSSVLGSVFIAGDVAYFGGLTHEFARCFDPYWGHARDRWHAVPGNHEYQAPGAMPYFDYFGDAGGPVGLGYHHFQTGEWLVLMINSNISALRDSPQYEYMRQALAAFQGRCAMGIWHHPLFSSGRNGPNPQMRDMFQLLFERNAELVVNGHDHVYERFSPQDPAGRPSDLGVRQITAGTGGAALTNFGVAAPNSMTRISEFGLLKLTLHPTSYAWEFLRTNGSVGDSGTTSCH